MSRSAARTTLIHRLDEGGYEWEEVHDLIDAVVEAEAAQGALDDVRKRIERTINDSFYGEDNAFSERGYLLRSTVLRALQDRGADREDVKRIELSGSGDWRDEELPGSY